MKAVSVGGPRSEEKAEFNDNTEKGRGIGDRCLYSPGRRGFVR